MRTNPNIKAERISGRLELDPSNATFPSLIIPQGSSVTASIAGGIWNNGTDLLMWNNSTLYTLGLSAAPGGNLVVSASGSINTVSQVVFSNANGVSFGLTGSTITASIMPSGGAQTGISGIIAGTQTASSGTVQFSNANGVSFGLDNQTITASVNMDISMFALGNTTQNSSTVLNASNLSFNGLGNITVGYSNGSIQISGSQSVQPQTNPNISMFALGNTTQNSSTLLNASNLSFNGLGIVTVGYSNGSIQVSASQSVQPQSNQNISLYGLGNTTQNSSTVLNASNLSFNGAGNITVGYSNGSIQLSGSQSVQPQTNQNISMFALGNTTQNSSTLLNASNLSFNGAGIITVGYSNGSIQLSASTAAQSSPNISLFALGNTTQNSSTVRNASNLSFNGLGIITVGYSNGSIQLSATQSSPNISLFALGNTTQNSSTVRNASNLSFNGLGNITVGYSNGSIQLSGSQSVQTQNMVSVNGSTGNVSFANGNNITFGFNASTVTASASFNQTNQNISLYGLGNTTQNSSTVLNASNLSFNGAGIVTVGYSNGSIQISASSAAQSVQTQNMVSVQGSTGNISFNNANNVTFGFNASTVTASASFPAQTNQNISLYGLGNTTQNSSTVLNASNLSFNGLGNITVGYSNGSIQLSGSQSVQPQSNQNISLYGLGNTTQNSSTVLNASNLSFNGLGIVTVGYSNGSIQISASSAQSVQTQNMVSVNGSTGNVSFANGNNVTFGFNASTVTASASFPAQTNQNISLFGLGNTTQNSSTVLNASNLSFNGAGIITVGYSNGSIQLSASTAAQTNQNISLFALGNTTQNSSTLLNASNMSFNGLGNITVGYSNGSIQVSGSQSVQTQNMVSVNGSTGNVSFANGNNVTFGFNASTVTASASFAQSNPNISLFALGNTTQNSSTVLNVSNLSFNGLGNITVGYSNGSIQISGAGAGVQSNQTLGLYALGNTTQNSSTTMDARTLSLNAIGSLTIGYSNGSIQFSAPNALTSQTNQNISLFALGNTTQNSSTVLNASNLSFNGLGNITVGYSNGSIQLSGSQSVQTQNMVSVNGSTGNVSFANGNNVTFGFNASTVTASASFNQTNQNISLFALGNTTQNSSTVLNAANLSFNGLGDITVGYSNGSIQLSGSQSAQTQSNVQAFYDGANSISSGTIRVTNANGVSMSINGQTLSASVTQQPTVSFFEALPAAGMQGNSVGNATLSFGRVVVHNPINATQMALIQHFSNSTNNGAGVGATITYSAAMYTMNGSTASLVSSATQSVSMNMSSNTNAASAYGGQSGTRYRTIDIGTWNITPGDYLFAVGMRISTSGTSMSVSHWCRPSVSINAIPGGGNFSQFFMHGVYSASTSGIPNSVQLSQINATGAAAQRVPYFALAGTF